MNTVTYVYKLAGICGAVFGHRRTLASKPTSSWPFKWEPSHIWLLHKKDNSGSQRWIACCGRYCRSVNKSCLTSCSLMDCSALGFPVLHYLWAFAQVSRSLMSDSLRPHGLYSPRNSPGQNTGMDSCWLLQGIFPTQEPDPGLLHCRQILYQLSHQETLSLLKLVFIELMMPSDHLILCCPILLLPSIFPCIRVSPNESALYIGASASAF